MFCLWCRLHTGKEAIHHLFRSQHCVILLLLHCLLLRFLFAIVFAFVFWFGNIAICILHLYW